MTKILLLGAGKIGQMIAHLLGTSGDYEITAADMDENNLQVVGKIKGVTSLKLDISDSGALQKAMEGQFAVLSASPFQLNKTIASAAAKAGIHYLDLTEDVASTRHVKELAKSHKGQTFIPQCGLAPGFISIVAYDLAKDFDSLDTVQLRVGALPAFPTNALKYNLTWSTDGLINEYIEPCEAVVRGKLMEVPALEEREEFSLDGVTYEAFNTSGGLGTLAETLDGKIETLNYKTIRYPGHRDILKLLLQDLRLADNRDVMKQMFEDALPHTPQDVVLIFVTASGKKNGRFEQKSWARKVYARTIAGQHCTAIQITTASGICGVLDLLREGKIPMDGFVRQEEIDLETFLANRFGGNYAFEGDDHHRY